MAARGPDRKIRVERPADVVSVDDSRLGLGQLSEVDPASVQGYFRAICRSEMMSVTDLHCSRRKPKPLSAQGV